MGLLKKKKNKVVVKEEVEEEPTSQVVNSVSENQPKKEETPKQVPIKPHILEAIKSLNDYQTTFTPNDFITHKGVSESTQATILFAIFCELRELNKQIREQQEETE